jgi:hypothetical protein
MEINSSLVGDYRLDVMQSEVKVIVQFLLDSKSWFGIWYESLKALVIKMRVVFFVVSLGFCTLPLLSHCA